MNMLMQLYQFAVPEAGAPMLLRMGSGIIAVPEAGAPMTSPAALPPCHPEIGASTSHVTL
jgi:hypothetical protein